MKLTARQFRRILMNSTSEIAIGEVHTAEAYMEAMAEEALMARYRSVGGARVWSER